ncbi:putative acyl-CoA dehydrogenase [Zopfochytrium polystomum]|nr:putative acyl-CoA dehydrogenase [Zopfochytrium polystomum]
MSSERIISKAELASHSSAASAWLAIDGRVFDVTDFLDAHPGGRRVVLPLLGKDASKEFHKFHNVVTVMGKYRPRLQIGVLEGAVFDADKDNYAPDADMFGNLVPFADPAWYQGWNTPYYKESHKRVRAWANELVTRELLPYVYEWDQAGEIPRSVFRRMGEAGLLTAITGVFPWPDWAPTPPPAGVKPEEWDMFHELIVLDEIGRTASVGLNQFLWVTPAIALTPVIHYASKELKDKLITPCLSGQKNIALGITEPYAGSDVAGLLTTAEKTADGNHYIINGEKKWITNGNWAEYFVIAARTGGKGMGGISLFLVERDTPGFSTRPVACQGCRGSGTAYLMLENVKVPAKNMIGKENKGFSYIMKNFNHERLSGAVGVVRMARTCYEDAMVYAQSRKTFGKTLFEHPVIRNKLGHMSRQIEATQAWMEFIVYQFQFMSPDEALFKMGGPTALLKVQCSTMLEFCAREASQIMGGIAYTKGGIGERVERIYRDVRGVAIPGGSEEIMLDLVSGRPRRSAKSTGRSCELLWRKER